MSNRNIEATLRINGKANTSEMARKVNRDLDSISRRAAEFNKRSGPIGKIQERIGMIGAASGVALAAGAYAAKQALVDFAAVERQMTRIGNTSGASSEETKAAFDELQQQAQKLALPLDQAIEGLDTLTASGMNLKEAMAFLPSVLATAQASGAATADVANAGLKAASALKIAAPEMQRAFDIMVAGGQAGQYELKDMAADIPRLANMFATLGYSGEDGLKRLVAILQTIREDTGTSEEAATAAENVFQKMFSGETSNKFKKFGIDLREEMKKAADSGEDTLTAFLRLTRQALNGDMTKLPLLFEDAQMQAGMRSLLTSTERLVHYMDELNNPSVNGTVYKNLQKVINDTQGSIDKFNTSYETLKLTLTSGVIAPAAVPVMDAITKKLMEQEAMRRGMEKRGYSKAHQLFGFTTEDDAKDLMFEGGYRDPEFLKDYWEYRYRTQQAGTSTGGPHAMPPVGTAEFPGGDHHYNARKLPASGVPIPSPRPSSVPSYQDAVSEREFNSAQHRFDQSQEGRRLENKLADLSGPNNVFGAFEDRLTASLQDGGDKAGDAIQRSGSSAADQMGASIRRAGDDAATAIAGRIVAAVVQAIKGVNSIGNPNGNPTRPQVNADTGRSMPSSGPMNGGGGGF